MDQIQKIHPKGWLMFEKGAVIDVLKRVNIKNGSFMELSTHQSKSPKPISPIIFQCPSGYKNTA